MINATVSDIIVLLGIASLAVLGAAVVVVASGIKYKKSRRIPPYKK